MWVNMSEYTLYIYRNETVINGEKPLKNSCKKKLDWRCSDYDHAVFFKSWNDRTWAIIGFWVCDTTSIGHQQWLLELEEEFRQQFSLSDESNIHWILGTAITRDIKQNLVSISHKDYIEDIAAKFQAHSSMTYKTLSLSASTCPPYKIIMKKLKNQRIFLIKSSSAV